MSKVSSFVLRNQPQSPGLSLFCYFVVPVLCNKLNEKYQSHFHSEHRRKLYLKTIVMIKLGECLLKCQNLFFKFHRLMMWDPMMFVSISTWCIIDEWFHINNYLTILAQTIFTLLCASIERFLQIRAKQ